MVNAAINTLSGLRDTRAEADLRRQGVTEETLRALEDLRLLRREDRAGVARVELTHDVLAPLMLKGRELGRRREERERREAQIRAEVEAAERDKRTELERGASWSVSALPM